MYPGGKKMVDQRGFLGYIAWSCSVNVISEFQNGKGIIQPNNAFSCNSCGKIAGSEETGEG